jgi:hypothetical protein
MRLQQRVFADPNTGDWQVHSCMSAVRTAVVPCPYCAEPVEVWSATNQVHWIESEFCIHAMGVLEEGAVRSVHFMNEVNERKAG